MGRYKKQKSLGLEPKQVGNRHAHQGLSRMPHASRDRDHRLTINQLNQFPVLCKSILDGQGFLFDKSAPDSLYSTPQRRIATNA